LRYGSAYNRAAVSRNAPTVLVLVLLLATATAFAVTQRLKLEPSPISQTRVAKVFSPVCECDSKAANIEFSLRRSDVLQIAIGIDGREVTVADGQFQRGRVHARLNGRGATGAVVPDGIYYAVVHLQRADRTIDLPNPIRLDTQPPSIAGATMRTTGDKTSVTYRVSEPAHALLIVNGRRAVYTYSTRRHGRLQWYGRVNGRPMKAKRLMLIVEDLAGNRSRPVRLSRSS
jgi:hypothetical protein